MSKYFIKLTDKKLVSDDISNKTANYQQAKVRSEKKGINYNYSEISNLPHAIEPPPNYVVVDIDTDEGYLQLQNLLKNTKSKISPERNISYITYKTNRGGHFWFKKPKIKDINIQDLIRVSFNASKINTYANIVVDYRDEKGYCVLALNIDKALHKRIDGSSLLDSLFFVDEMPLYLLPQKALDKKENQFFEFLNYQANNRDDQVFKKDIPTLRMLYQDEITDQKNLKALIFDFIFEKTKLYHQDKESVVETKKWINDKINSSFKMGEKMFPIKTITNPNEIAIKPRPPQKNLNKGFINTDIAKKFVDNFKFVEQKPFFYLNVKNKLQILNEEQVKKQILDFGLENNYIDENIDVSILKSFFDLVKIIASENKLLLGDKTTICFQDLVIYDYNNNTFKKVDMVDLNYLPVNFFDETESPLDPNISYKKIDDEIRYFLSYFQEILGNNNFTTLLQALAISMTHNPAFEVYFEWFGPQGTGKSTTQLFFQQILGSHNTISFKIEALSRQFSQHLLFNKLAAFEPDLENVSFYKMAEGQIRTLTSGVPIAAEIKNSNIRQESTPYATIHILTNYTISTSERRRYLIPFLKVSDKKEFKSVKNRVLNLKDNTKRYFVWRALKELQLLKDGIINEKNKKLIVQSADVQQILNNSQKIEIVYEFVNSQMFYNSLVSAKKNGLTYESIFKMFEIYVETTQATLQKKYDLAIFSRDVFQELSKPVWKNTIYFSVEEKKYYHREILEKQNNDENQGGDEY